MIPTISCVVNGFCHTINVLTLHRWWIDNVYVSGKFLHPFTGEELSENDPIVREYLVKYPQTPAFLRQCPLEPLTQEDIEKRKYTPHRLNQYQYFEYEEEAYLREHPDVTWRFDRPSYLWNVSEEIEPITLEEVAKIPQARIFKVGDRLDARVAYDLRSFRDLVSVNHSLQDPFTRRYFSLEEMQAIRKCLEPFLSILEEPIFEVDAFNDRWGQQVTEEPKKAVISNYHRSLLDGPVYYERNGETYHTDYYLLGKLLGEMKDTLFTVQNDDFIAQGILSSKGRQGVWEERDHEGNLTIRATFKDGLLHGKYEIWRGGKIVEVREYRHGLLTGTRILFHDNGQKKLEENYLDDVLCGSSRAWTESGKLIMKVFFDRGRMISHRLYITDAGIPQEVEELLAV